MSLSEELPPVRGGRRLPRPVGVVLVLGGLLLLAVIGWRTVEGAIPADDGATAGDAVGREQPAGPAGTAPGSGQPLNGAGSGDDPDPEPSPEPEAEPEPEGEPGPEGPPVTIAFGGDVMFEGMLRPQLDADPEGLLDPIAPVLGAADLAVVNLETAITTGGSPEPKQFVFRAPPTGLQALKAADVDVASLANNHGMDFGREGLEDTLDASTEVGLPLIGAGRHVDEAYEPFTATVRGRDIAIIGATDVMDSAFFGTWPATPERPGLASAKDHHEERLVDEVGRARATADTVVVFLHWGVEGETCPSERQQSLAGTLVDAGADVVVGGHAHRLQGAGMLGDALVAYGLGNFVFYSSGGPGAESGVLTATVEGREVVDYEWTPARLREGVPHPLEGDEAAAALTAWEDLRDCTNLTAD